MLLLPNRQPHRLDISLLSIDYLYQFFISIDFHCKFKVNLYQFRWQLPNKWTQTTLNINIVS